MTKITRKKHIGSDFDDFLCDETLLADVQATAIERVLALQIETAMRAQGISKADLSKRLHTSRTQLDRLLDPGNASITLQTIGRLAQVLAKRLVFRLEAASKKHSAA